MVNLAAIALLATACDSKETTGIKAAHAASIDVISGSNQAGFVGIKLSGRVVVAVKDSAGNPLPGVTVHFSSPDLLSVVFPETVVSDASGRAATDWTLGGKKGTQSIHASVNGVANPAVITVIALPGEAVSGQIIQGDNQTAPVNTTLALPLKILFTDRFLNHVDGVTVTYSGTDGTGHTATAPSAVSDTAGVATTSWIIHGVGPQTLQAFASGSTIRLTFTAFGTD
jgi:hypothetical protein